MPTTADEAIVRNNGALNITATDGNANAASIRIGAGAVTGERQSLGRAKTLAGLFPICACCKRIRDDQGYWQQVEAYISEHSDAVFTHGICPECFKEAKEELKSSKAEAA